MPANGRENALGPPVALPRRALAGSAAAKALEALTLAGLVLIVPRALGPADYGGFAVALAIATAISTATGIGGPALFARVLGPLGSAQRRALGLTLVRRLGAVRAVVVAVLVALGAIGLALAPGTASAPQVALVLIAAGLGTAATLLSQLALGLQRTAAWSLRYPLENGVIVVAALVLYPLAGLDGAIAAVALGAASALALGLATSGREIAGATPANGRRLPTDVLRFARLQAAGGALTQTVHRGAAPACALLGVGAAATGHAAIAAGAALAITYAVMQTTLVALPGAAHTFASDRSAAEASLRRMAALAALVVVPACALLALAAEPLLETGLGDGFRDAAQPLRIALAAAAAAPLWALATQLAALRNRPEAVLAGAATGAAAFVLVVTLTLPGGGAEAAASAMLAGVAATIAGTFAALLKRQGLRPPVAEHCGPASIRDPRLAGHEQRVPAPVLAGAAHPRAATAVAHPLPQAGDDPSRASISVVVATRDRPAALERCLRALARQTATLEIVVVDDGCADATAVRGALERSTASARVVTGTGQGPAAARNRGAHAARGAIVCFTDDDCEPEARWAEQLAIACAQGGAAAGTTVAGPAAGHAAAASQIITHTLQVTSLHRATGLLGFAPTCNLACRADVLRALPFDESFPLAAGEDRDWCARLAAAGVPLRFAAQATVIHRPRMGPLGMLRQHQRYGRGAVRFRAIDERRLLAGRAFYRRLARSAARGGPRVAALVVLAQAAGAVGAAREAIDRRHSVGRKQRLAGNP